MKRRMILLAAAVLIGAVGPAMAQPRLQRGDEGAEAFVRGVYAAYADNPEARPPDIGDPAVWSPRMTALIRRDRELATDDLPLLDADPLCECQDWEDLRVLTVRIQRDRPGWKAVVVFVNGGEMLMTHLKLTGDPNRGWRIDDVLDRPRPGLAADLEASNRRIEAGGRALYRD